MLCICWVVKTTERSVRNILFMFSDTVDYCHEETFNANCLADEVILMTSALYGRMRMGDCVKIDMGFIGCKKNVLDIMDKRCSGRRKCSIDIPDKILEDEEPCLELKSYLQASYKCVKGRSNQLSVCQR